MRLSDEKATQVANNLIGMYIILQNSTEYKDSVEEYKDYVALMRMNFPDLKIDGFDTLDVDSLEARTEEQLRERSKDLMDAVTQFRINAPKMIVERYEYSLQQIDDFCSKYALAAEIPGLDQL
ncbi:hypothetical protein H6503_04350 [Candidatus Woesearchaeota archaeon]|nr:hypothetical protein [Candidatus Woesearchaeota archaeon]